MADSKSQWGSSLQQLAPNTGATSKRLVSMRFDSPKDVVLYMEGQAINDGGTFSGPTTARYLVSVGAGGVSLEQGVTVVPAVGAARHYVTDSIDVDVQLAAIGGGWSRRVAAGIALGRPSVSYRVGDLAFSTVAPGTTVPPANAWNRDPSLSGWSTVGNSAFAWIRVPSYATRVRMQIGEFSAGVAAADIQVREVNWAGDFYAIAAPDPSPTGIQLTAADYLSDWQMLAPQTVYLRMRCGIVGGTARVLVMFERIQ